MRAERTETKVTAYCVSFSMTELVEALEASVSIDPSNDDRADLAMGMARDVLEKHGEEALRLRWKDGQRPVYELLFRAEHEVSGG